MTYLANVVEEPLHNLDPCKSAAMSATPSTRVVFGRCTLMTGPRQLHGSSLASWS
jgi:hypothetical protein